jgi:hypothetical protein
MVGVWQGGVGFMKDEEIKFEEIEDCHQLGGVGEGRVQGRGKCRCYSAVRHTMIHQSRKGTHIGGWVANAQAPVYKCERGGARRVRAPQVFQRQFFCLLKRRKSKHPFQGRKYSITVRFYEELPGPIVFMPVDVSLIR